MNIFDRFMHELFSTFGIEIPSNSPDWVHTLMHVAFIVTPSVLAVLAAFRLYNYISRRHRDLPSLQASIEKPNDGIYKFVFTHTGKSQIYLLFGGVLSLPLLYLTLELPKNIINKAIDAEDHATSMFGMNLTQLDHLYILCFFYLFIIVSNGAFKYWINVYRGRVSERLLLILRQFIYEGWCEGKGVKRKAEIIPIVSQEVEPVGGFAGEAVATPIIQGGTFITIVLFMFVQNPVLGAAALILIPVQIMIIPRYQRRLNRLTRVRLNTLRNLGGFIGDIGDIAATEDHRTIYSHFMELKSTREEYNKTKFLMKFTNNLLIAFTPFTFFSIGGYLVINDQLTLGALIAVLSAYKDLSSPLRELFRYYQTKEDITVRYEELRVFIT